MRIIKCPHCQKEFMNAQRSTSLNNYLHSIFNEIANHIGDVSIEQVKEDVMNAVGFTEYRPNILTGEETLYRRSTAKMNNADCSELTDKVRIWAEEFLGLVIPDAQEFKEGMRAYKK